MLIIAVDIGGTAVKSASVTVTDRGFTLSDSGYIPTGHIKKGEDVQRAVTQAVMRLSPENADGIAVGVAGKVDWKNGIVTESSALPCFRGMNMKLFMEQSFGLPATVINDAEAALLGECAFGAAIGFRRPLMLTLGTGLGSAMTDDYVHPSQDSFRFGDLGHVVLYENGRKCKCGQRGCIEQYVSATAIKQNAGAKNIHEVLKIDSESNIKAKERFIFDFVAAVEKIKKITDFDVLIAGGGVIELKDYWWDDFVKSLGDTVAVPAKLGNRAALYGAAFAHINGRF